MELRILSSKDYQLKLKCTIQTSGKLGFTDATAKHLNLDNGKGVKFAIDNNENLYLINGCDIDSDTFRVNKAGNYFYIRAKGLFDSLKLDYISKTIIFDMARENSIIDQEIYKLIKRELPRK